MPRIGADAVPGILGDLDGGLVEIQLAPALIFLRCQLMHGRLLQGGDPPREMGKRLAKGVGGSVGAVDKETAVSANILSGRSRDHEFLQQPQWRCAAILFILCWQQIRQLRHLRLPRGARRCRQAVQKTRGPQFVPQ